MTEAISECWALVEECAENGWDGNDGAPISAIAAQRATAFIRVLPAQFPLPEMAPEPDGAISLDWIRSRDRVFSLSIGAGRRLPYAWIDRTDSGHAVAFFDGTTVPPRMLEAIRRIMD